MENDEGINKFNEAEVLVGGMLTFGVDFVCALIDLTGIGMAISPVIQGSMTFAMGMWFKNKGDKNGGKIGRQIAKYSANFLPIVPTNLTVFLIEVFVHNHPKVAKITGQTAGAAVGAAIGGPAGARIGAAAGEYAMGGSATESITDAATSKIPLKK